LYANVFRFRAVIRFISSCLKKLVDSLAPAITNLLVRGKIVRKIIFNKIEKQSSSFSFR